MILNSKKRKQVVQQLQQQFGCDDVFEGYAFLLNENRGKLYLVRQEVASLDLAGVRVDTMGMYIGAIMNDNSIRLSIEGSQLIGPSATKHVLNINDEQAHDWVRGEDIPCVTENKAIHIVKHNNDFLGCGKPVKDTLHNYVPKTRYVRSKD